MWGVGTISYIRFLRALHNRFLASETVEPSGFRNIDTPPVNLHLSFLGETGEHPPIQTALALTPLTDLREGGGFKMTL